MQKFSTLIKQAAPRYVNGFPVMEPVTPPKTPPAAAKAPVATGKAMPDTLIPTQPQLPRQINGIPVKQPVRPMPTPSAFYDAIQSAETGGLKDPWIRTKHAPAAGSTAFGPVQLTGNKAVDYYKRSKTPILQHKPIVDKLQQQAALFKKYGRNPKAPGYSREYDYGGAGLGFTDQDKLRYKGYAQSLMSRDLQAATGANPGNNRAAVINAIQRWRGVPQEKDPGYYSKVLTKLGY